MVVQPKIAINCRSVAPFSAASAAPAFRNPWAEQWFNPASSHCFRNQLLKPFEVKGLPSARCHLPLPGVVASSTAQPPRAGFHTVHTSGLKIL